MTLPLDLTKYLTPRGGGNSWAQSPATIAAWRRGALADVRPIMLEFMPVLTCNADCVLCPFRRSRLDMNVRRHRSGFAVSDDITVATRPTVIRILEASREAGVRGVLWTGGGEPTLLEGLDSLCAYSADLGMTNALYTNGFLLGTIAGLAERLLAPATRFAFIRMSINAVTPRAVQQHWGVKDPEEALCQLRGLEELLRVRERLLPQYAAAGWRIPSIQISTIIDHKNHDDLLKICQTVADIFRRCRITAGEEDVMVVRPTVDHRREVYSCHDHEAAVIQHILYVCAHGGRGWSELDAAGVPLFLGFGLDQVEFGRVPNYDEVIRREYEQRESCLAHGLFFVVGPDATLYPCTEMGCDPAWALGNLKEQSVDEIYRSARRMDFLRRADSCHWGPEMFQPHSRTARLDRIARVIRDGELTDADIEVIRQESLKSHTLLLN